MSSAGLSMVRGPCVIQQYHDHSGTFFKVYVIENEVMVYRRPSLPDLELHTALGVCSQDDLLGSSACNLLPNIPAVKSIVFDSRFAYPTIRDFLASTADPKSRNQGIPMSCGGESNRILA